MFNQTIDAYQFGDNNILFDVRFIEYQCIEYRYIVYIDISNIGISNIDIKYFYCTRNICEDQSQMLQEIKKI